MLSCIHIFVSIGTLKAYIKYSKDLCEWFGELFEWTSLSQVVYFVESQPM